MSFWNSIERKARKEHKCVYCHETIEKGEKYSRESGMFEGDFQDYCLCLRCGWLIDTFGSDDGYLTDIYETIFNNDLVICPSCGSRNLREYDITKDKQFMECECDNCDEKWVADLTIQALGKQISKKPLGISIAYESRVGNCPSCNLFIREVTDKICLCGQKLNWS